MDRRRRGGAVQRALPPKRPRLEGPHLGKSQVAYSLVREVVGRDEPLSREQGGNAVLASYRHGEG